MHLSNSYSNDVCFSLIHHWSLMLHLNSLAESSVNPIFKKSKCDIVPLSLKRNEISIH